MASLVVDFASTDGISLPDLDKAKAAGMRAAVPRAIYGRAYGSQSPVYKDPVWDLNKDRIKAAGLCRSTYLLLCVPRKGLITPDPEVQIDALCDYAPLTPPTPGGYCKDYVAFVDVEEPSDRLTPDQYYDWILRACRHYKCRTGYMPGLYDSARVWIEYLKNHAAGELAQCYRWYAKPWPWDVRTPPHLDGAPGYYPTVPKQFGDSTAWGWYQFQGDAVPMPGFPGAVDLSRPQLLKKGATGDVVKWIQRCVGATIDGAWGPKTDDLVAAYQTKYGMTADRIVGVETMAPMSWTPFAE